MNIENIKNGVSLKGVKFLTIVSVIIFLFIYALTRAKNISFTHDEGLSYSILVGNSPFKNSANNHFLNTFLMQFTSLFSESEFMLRLPNVLSIIGYGIGVYLIISRNSNLFIFLTGIILMFCHPYMLEFFGLARGYGMSISFLVLGLYYLLKSNTDRISLERNFLHTFIFLGLGMFSNFNLINIYIGAFLIFAYEYLKIVNFKIPKKLFKSRFFFYLIGTIAVLIVGVDRLLFLKSQSQLYFGASSFYKGFEALINHSIYIDLNRNLTSIILCIVAIALILGVTFVIFQKKKSIELIKIIALILLVSLGIILESKLFDAKFPMDRTALYFIPILSIFFFFFIRDALIKFRAVRFLSPVIFIAVIWAFAENTLAGLNLDKTQNWSFDQFSKSAILKVQELSEEQKEPVSLGVNWLFEPSVNYYIHSLKLNIDSVDRNGPKQDAEFNYLLDSDSAPEGYSILQEYKESGAKLYIKDAFKFELNRFK